MILSRCCHGPRRREGPTRRVVQFSAGKSIGVVSAPADDEYLPTRQQGRCVYTLAAVMEPVVVKVPLVRS